MLEPAAGEPGRLCGRCAGIDPHHPFRGPEYSKVGSEVSTRIVYEHAASLAELERAARHDGCHLCYLLLDVICKYNELVADPKNVVDDWEQVDLINDELDEFAIQVNVPREIQQRHQAFFMKPSASFEDISGPDAPVLLDLTFRAPMRDEPANRCTDVAVHWKHTDGLSRTTSAFNLVCGLPGMYWLGCLNRCKC